METVLVPGPAGRRVLRLLAAGIFGLTAAAAASPAENVAIKIATRVRTGGETSLLVEATGPAGKAADEITLGLPAKLASAAKPAHLPAGWSAARDGSSLRLSGPAASLPLRLRLDASGVDAPARVSARLRSRGAILFEAEVDVTRAPPVKVMTNLEGVLGLPKTLYAGDTVTFEPLDAARTPAGGQWTVAGMLAQEMAAPGRAAGLFRLRIPDAARAGDSIAASYTDPWGERVVEAPSAARCGGDAPSHSDKPRLEACAPMAFAGQAACVCGWFPTDAAREGLTLNGKPLGAPVTGSSGVVFVRIPAETPPGAARIGGLESAGFSPRDQATTTVLQVGGEIDRNKLLRGESTPMRLWVQGTTEPLPLHIRNETPETIRLDGGNDQLASTDGKTPNGLTRTVYAVHAGDFHITYSLATDPCPCSRDTVPQTEARPTPTRTLIPVTYPTFPPDLRTREKIPTPVVPREPSPTPTPRDTGDRTRERTYTPTHPGVVITTSQRSYTPTPPPPWSTYTPTKPSPTPRLECKLTYKFEGGPGISIDAVVPAPPATSKKNEPIPLYVSASDMDQLLQTCTCFIDGVEVSSTHKYIDVPDTVQYRWQQSSGKGALAGRVGPATLYQPPTLKVGESDSATIQAQMVDLRDNDKAAYVTFTLTVKREEECKYRRTVSMEKKSDPGRKRAITDLSQGVTCDPQDPSWDKAPVPIQAVVPGKRKVCVGERVVLTASGSDEDLLTLTCQGRCGSDLNKPALDDPVKYAWHADTGGFPDYGGHATTNSDSTSVIYVAPSKPGPDVVHIHVEDSGKEARDTPADKVIPITAYKLDLLVDGDKDETAPDCDAYFLCLNDDDDDEKGVDDRQPEPEKVAGEEDRVKITLKMEPEKSGNVILEASAGNQRIRVWTAQTGGKQVPLPYAVPKLPVDLWVEGIKASDQARDVELVLRSDDPHCEVRKLFTVEGPEIEMDGVPHEKRANPGGFVCVNKDFENDPTKRVMDKDNPVADPDKEHDLVPITLDKKPKEGSVTFDVPAGGNRVRVWKKSADGKNLKGSRAEGNSYNAADLPVTLWVEGAAHSGEPRDVRMRLTDDDSGCVSLLQVTVVEVELKASMRNRGGGFVLVPDVDREKKGAFVAVNEDDDDANGKLDVTQRPVPGEDDLLRLDVDIKPKQAAGKITLLATAGSDHVQLWLEPTKGTALDFVKGVTLNESALPKTFWLEGFTASAAPRDVELTLRCTDPRPCEDKLKVTAVSLHLQTDLDLDGTINQEKDWKLERKPGAYIVVNNDDDDRNGRPDLLDDRVDALAAAGAAPPAGARPEQDLKLFQIVGPLPAALQNEGKVILRRSNANIAVYSVAEKGTGARILWSTPPGAVGGAAFAAATERNGIKTWDLSDPVERGQFISVRDHLWVEGVSPSGAERDTSLTLSYVPKDGGVEIEMNRIDITVVRFDRLRAVIEPTPELPPRNPGNVPAKHNFDNSAAGIVYHLNENKGDPDKNFDDKRGLVLIRKANEEVPLALDLQPKALAVQWSVARSRDDSADLGKGVPAIDAAGAGGAKLRLDEQGSFLVFCYVDANGNGKFDEGEPRMILPLILVDAEVKSNDSVAHNHVTPTVNAGSISVASGTGPGGGFNIAAPNDAAVYLAGQIEVRGGGPQGRRGLDKVFAGWVQDIPVDLDVSSDFQGGHRVSYIFARAPHPAGNLYLPPPAAAPNVIASPILDSGRSPRGVGGGTATLSRSQKSVVPGAALGQRWLVETVDSPRLGYYLNHPGFPAPNALTAFRFNLTFRAWLSVWTNLDQFFVPAVPPPAPPPPAVAERTYSAILEVNWRLRGSWTLDAAGQPVAPFLGGPSCSLAGSNEFHPPARGSDRQMAVREPSAIQNLAEDARN